MFFSWRGAFFGLVILSAFEQSAFGQISFGGYTAGSPSLSIRFPVAPLTGVNIPLVRSSSSPPCAHKSPMRGSYNPYMSVNNIYNNYSPTNNSLYGLGALGGYGLNGGFGLGNFGAGPGIGYGYALSSMGSLTAAEGQYWKDTNYARISREQSRQAAIDTTRRQIEYEQWVDSVRPTAPKLQAAERATNLEMARRHATDIDITSGKALNILLKSIQSSGSLSRGPNLPLTRDTLSNINLWGSTSPGNAGMLKVIGSLTWPVLLRAEAYDEPRDRLVRNLAQAVRTIKEGEPVPVALRKDIRSDFATIDTLARKSANDATPSEYIEARRFLSQLDSAIKVLPDPHIGKYFNGTWSPKGNNVAEVVDQMTRDGLTFAPAAPGEEASYRVLYQEMRAFENGVQVAAGQ